MVHSLVMQDAMNLMFNCGMKTCILYFQDGDTRSLKVTLHRSSGSLGFNIMGGTSCGVCRLGYVCM